MKDLRNALIGAVLAVASVILWSLFLKDKKKNEKFDKEFDEIFDCDDEHETETYQKSEEVTPLENQNIDEEATHEDSKKSLENI